MTRADPLQESFNGGELAPSLHSRAGLAKYQAGAATLSNWLPDVQGPAVKRAGTRYLRELNNTGKRGWLARFVFNTTDACVLEFTPGRLRFFTAAGILLSDDDSSLQLVTPWTEADLTSEDGTFGLSLVQSGDVIYAAHRKYRTRKITRLSATSWTIASFNPFDGPFLDKNAGSTTVYASAATGSVTLTASAAIFTPAMVGGLIRLWAEQLSGVKPWEAQQQITADDYRRNDGKVYRALNSSWTGSVPPTHREGSAYDSSGKITDPSDGSGLIDAGVAWQYRHSGYGVVEITDVAGATSATGIVRSRLPDEVVGSGNATPIWELGAWPGGDTDGHPACVAFFRNRLILGRDRTLWTSKVKAFEQFGDRTASQVLDDDAMTLTVGGDRIQRMKWLCPMGGDRLVIGTEAGELGLQSISPSAPFGPSNAQVVELSAYGSRRIRPEAAQGRIVFAQRSGKQMLAARPAQLATGDGLEIVDLSVLADHLSEIGVMDFAWQGAPDNRLWCVARTGACFTLTWHPEQEVAAWARFKPGGTGAVEAVCTIPNPDGGGDDVFLVTRRTIDGTIRRFVEVLSRPLATTALADAYYVDCGVQESRAPTVTTIGGLAHLAGETVQVLADGRRQADKLVPASGTITLDRAAAKVSAGLGYTAELISLPIDAGNPMGTALAKLRRIIALGIRVILTGSLEVSADGSRWEETQRRPASTPYGEPPPLQTTWRMVRPFPGGWSIDPRIRIRSTAPLPATLAALAPEIATR